MFSLSYIITKLYPAKSLEEKEELIRLCDAESREYEEFMWAEVTSDQLADRNVQLNLAMTVYRSQFYYWGVVDEIMRSLGDWTATFLDFPWLSEEDNRFYLRLYTFLGFINFHHIEQLHQLSLLGTRCLPLACLAEVPIYINVQNYFARYTYVPGMQDDAAFMANAIEKNATELGTEGKTIKSIQAWVSDFNAFFGSSLAAKVDEFMESSLTIARLDETERKILHQIVTLYYGLQGGFIWREIEGPDGLMAFDPEVSGVKLTSENKTADDYYIQVLYEVKDITPWLEDWQSVVHWLDITGKTEDFVQKLLFVLLEKVDLNNQKQVGLTLEFLSGLKGRGVENADEILFFDEKTGKFQWDEDFFIPGE